MRAQQLRLAHLLRVLELPADQDLFITDAGRLTAAHHPAFSPDVGALVTNLSSGTAVLPALRSQYPDQHPLQAVVQQGSELKRAPLRLADLGEMSTSGEVLALYVPPLRVASSFEALQETVAHLRGPEGCPWDREQTHQSLRKHLLEEAYEALDALDRRDLEALREELGDLLLQILLQAQIASEAGDFNAADVVAGIQSKLIRRHPHVFGDLELSDVDQVLRNWEHFKEAEKGNGVLQGVPSNLPALAQALELQGRAARVGFDWPRVEGVLEKVGEELEEIRAAPESLREGELGDLLFAIVNYARWIGADPEAALRESNRRFRQRFDRMSGAARRSGRQLEELGLEELERLWEAAKQETD